MQTTIEISDDLQSTLVRLADGRTNEEYASLIVNNLLKSEFKMEAINKIATSTPENLSRYTDAVKGVFEAIEAEKPVPVEEVISEDIK